MNVASADSVERAVPRLVEACRAASARALSATREKTRRPLATTSRRARARWRPSRW